MAQSLVAKPVEPMGEGVVVRWYKWGNTTPEASQGYAYASISDGNGTWFTTQDPRRTGGQKILPLDWDALLDKIGERNWASLELLD